MTFFLRVGTGFSGELPQARTVLIVRSYSHYSGQIFFVEISVSLVGESNTKFTRQVACCICVIGSEINYPPSLKLQDNASLTDQ